jgi:hypothetical protein
VPSVTAGPVEETLFRPLEVRSALVSTAPGPIVTLPGQGPVRYVRQVWLDEVVSAPTAPAATAAVLETTATRIEWVPVSLPRS